MQVHTVTTQDNTQITYAISGDDATKPWIVFVIPFGIRGDLAQVFFDFFSPTHNLLTWESRIIFSERDENVEQSEFMVEKHVADLSELMAICGIDKAILVGYCSGAGVSLKAAQTYPDKFEKLVLVSGEYTLLDKPECMTQFGLDIDSLLPIASEDAHSAQFIIDRLSFIKTPNVPDGVHLAFSNAHYFQQFAKSYLSYRELDCISLANQISHKTLLIAGEADLQTNVTSSQIIATHINGAQIHIDPNADHYDILRPHSGMFERIRQFIEGSGND